MVKKTTSRSSEQARSALAAKVGALKANSRLTQHEIAVRAGLGQGTISRILHAQVDPQSDSVRRLAAAFGLTVAALLGEDEPPAGGELPARPPATSPKSEPPLTIERTRPLLLSAKGDGRAVPVIPREQLGEFVKNERQQWEAERWLLCPKPCGARTIALRVEGAAMEPRFNHGDVIFLDPDVPAVPGKFVVVVTEPGEVLFRELVAVERDRRYVRALNPDWPGPKITSLEPGAAICGVVVGRFEDL